MMTGIAELFSFPAPASRVAGVLSGSYALGCFTAGYYLVRWRLGRDIREFGSGSVGARNVGRVLGTGGLIATVLGDFGKGALAVWIAHNLLHDARMTGFAMLAVVMGHIWPVQLGFRGGKGVATSLGALAVYDFQLALAFVLLFAGLLLVLRRGTLSGLLAFAVLPFAAKIFAPEPGTVMIVSILTVMILFAHWKNLLAEFTQPAPSVEKMEPPNN